jgi:hypothetical protein
MLLGTLVNADVACRIVAAEGDGRAVGGMSVPNTGMRH